MTTNKKHFKNVMGQIKVLVFFLLFTSSCKKFVAIDPPKDQLSITTVFDNDEGANAAMRGLYSEMVASFNNIANGALSLFPSLSADEMIRTSTSSIYDPFSDNNLVATDIRVSGPIWHRAYFHLYQANSIIENLQNSAGVSASVKNQLSGEAKFMRAFFHFYLVNLFGPVPLVTSTDYRENASLVRSDTGQIYQQIVEDLKEAKGLLTNLYPTAEKIRVNRQAVSALLSRVYLYRKNWAAAEAESSNIITSSLYRLVSVDSVFIPNNSEAILQFLPPLNSGINTAEGFNFVPSSASVRPNFILTQFAIDAFEPDDKRKTKWTKTHVVNGVSYTFPYKYKIKTITPGEARTEYYIVLRLAEQYLVRAEARAEQGRLTEALDDLNILRTRAGLTPLNLFDQQSILSAIEKERQTEFFIEWGHRWFDLKRNGKADVVLGVRKAPTWQPTDQLYPIPQSDINNNPALTQNAGY